MDIPSTVNDPIRPVRVAAWSGLRDRSPAYALVGEVDLVVVRHDNEVSVLYGRCLHCGALLSDGHVVGPNLICGVHGWDYRLDSGVSEYANDEALQRFQAWIDEAEDAVLVDEQEVFRGAETHPQPYRRDEYQGLYADVHGGPEEPFNGLASAGPLAGTHLTPLPHGDYFWSA